MRKLILPPDILSQWDYTESDFNQPVSQAIGVRECRSVGVMEKDL
jgi:hypothetical protein